VNKTIVGRYPAHIAARVLSTSGYSKLCTRFLSSANYMKLVGKVQRYSYDRKGRDQDDPFFAEFCVSKLGSSPISLFTKYGLAVPNKLAGYSSLIKYDKPQPILDSLIRKKAMEWTKKHFAIMGNSKVWHDFDYIKSELNMSASAGFGWGSDPSIRTKRDFYNCPGAKEFVDSYFDDIKHQYGPVVFWTNNVKEEIRDREKIFLNKLRTFTGSPIEHVHACTRMFGDMNDKFYRSGNTGAHWSFVGSTKFRRGWTQLFRRLSKHPNAYELDESEYDSSLFREVMYFMADLRVGMLAEEERTQENINRVWNLYVEIVDSVIVTQDGDVVTKNTGNPSGSSNTIVDNTIILFFLLAYAWLILCPEDFSSYESFTSNVEAALNGDDNDWTVSDVGNKFFNALQVSKVWSGLGVTTKYGDSPDPRKLEDCQFLSSSFKKIGLDWVPVPDTQKVMCSMAYHLKSPTPRWSLLRACALRIESFWNDECRQLLHSYILWLLTEYAMELRVPCDPADQNDVFTFEHVFAVFKTDFQLRSLYLCEEGAGTADLSSGEIALLTLNVV